MNITQSFKLAFKSIIGNKLRSFLTMLGMIIGVSSVIILISLVQGASGFIISTFANVGADVISVSVWGSETRYVSVEDMDIFIEKNKELIKDVSPIISANYDIKKTDGKTKGYNVTGISDSYQSMTNMELSSGRYIDYADIKFRSRVCVIGPGVVDEVFGGKVTVGDKIKIQGEDFKIVGINKTVDDKSFYIPYTTACKVAGSTQISAYGLTAKDSSKIDIAVAELDKYLFSIMKSRDYYYIDTMKQFLTIINTIKTILSAALGGIAGISLLVAGIGIMNIMLVSVIERTKEIGIRKSMGAKKKDIIRQFVIEAASISAIGGSIGILFGILVTNGLSSLINTLAAGSLGSSSKFSASPSIGAIILAFSVSTGIGICFGYMPAKKAAKLNPIDALRSE